MTERRPRGQSQSKGRAKPASGKGAPKPARAGGSKGKPAARTSRSSASSGSAKPGSRRAADRAGPSPGPRAHRRPAAPSGRVRRPEALVRRAQADERRFVVRPPPRLRWPPRAARKPASPTRKPASPGPEAGIGWPPAGRRRPAGRPGSRFPEQRRAPVGQLVALVHRRTADGRAAYRHGWAHRRSRCVPGWSAAPGRPAEEARPRLDRRAPVGRDVAPGPIGEGRGQRRRDAAKARATSRAAARRRTTSPASPHRCASSGARRDRLPRPARVGRSPSGPGTERRPPARPAGPDRRPSARSSCGSRGRAGAKLYEQLGRAADALEADREKDALRLLRPLRTALPASATVRELLGVALYRSGRYDQAAEELEAYVAYCGAVDQHPALMDCYRALRDYGRVKELWDELGQTAAAPEVVAEGRIVYAGSLADRGRVKEAISLLDRRAADVKNVRDFHLRLWYALADLEERAGNLPRARTLFERISRNDPGFADVMERLVGLG